MSSVDDSLAQVSRASSYAGSVAGKRSPRLWLIRRNCALSPGQLAAWLCCVSSVSLSIALLFAFFGAWVVLPFSLLEILVITAAYFYYGRHAGDFERIEARSGKLIVEWVDGLHSGREEPQASAVRIDFDGSWRSAVYLVFHGKKVAVGRFVPHHERLQFVTELRQALSWNQTAQA